MDYEGLRRQGVMGDGWSNTQGCDKQDKLYAQLKESFSINIISATSQMELLFFLKKGPNPILWGKTMADHLH